jgi:hyaluronan synthase
LLKAERLGIMAEWTAISRKGKRQAQGETILRVRKIAAEFGLLKHRVKFMTVDSDGILDPNAVDELLKPFADPKVFSVAGVVIAVNNTKNLLARFTDLWYVTSQLVDRSAQSTMNSVLVNSGVIAMYRFEVPNGCLDAYLNETFFGRAVEFSDDSRLTLEALQYGKTVQQTSAIAFTLMPENLSHHIRQYTRWMRGSFIRSWWRFKYLPLNKTAYWVHFIRWTMALTGSFMFADIFIAEPALKHQLSPWLLLITVLIGYMQSLKYLTIKRSDESGWSQAFTYLLSPIASLWAYFVLRSVQWYARATCLKTGWGTRNEVEVGLGSEEMVPV